jgi:hypothetical protein
MRNNNRRLAKHWDNLEATGVPLEPLEYRVGIGAANSALTIRAGRHPRRAEIMDLESGHSAFILPVFIRANGPGKTIICDASIGTLWPDTNIEWIDDPRESKSHPQYYCFPSDTEHFMREEVLNHRIKCNLPPGDIREGLLLAVGSRPPGEYLHQNQVPITLTLVDQWDFEHRATFRVRIGRRSTPSPERNVSKRGPLFSRRDILLI